MVLVRNSSQTSSWWRCRRKSDPTNFDKEVVTFSLRNLNRLKIAHFEHSMIECEGKGLKGCHLVKLYFRSCASPWVESFERKQGQPWWWFCNFWSHLSLGISYLSRSFSDCPRMMDKPLAIRLGWLRLQVLWVTHGIRWIFFINSKLCHVTYRLLQP